ncbi:MAG: PD40 domain-containing protein [Muribaculaceae bacterium]|nr:PD40 domain-containing protein [Muribaculaceae bacterium]
MRKILSYIVLAGTALCAEAITPLWLRDVKISPDGEEIAFTYKGDIYKVPTTGGTATRLTSRESYEGTPIWSPDGSQIAFASDRNGSMDIYVMASAGGTATRLTFHSGNETPESFSPDGKQVIFSGNIQDPASSVLFPSRRLTEVYSIAVTGGRISRILGSPAQMICFNTAGDSFLYQDQKGMEDEWRKHHTSSITRDIWSYDLTTGKHTNLTNRAGEDRNPILSPDGKTVFFLSERDGKTFNVYSFPTNAPEKVTQITEFTTHPVRFLSAGGNGTMAFTYNGEIYTKTGYSSPEKVDIDIILDDDNPIRTLSVTSDATTATVSPDGKQVAFINRGEIFVTSAEYKTTKQITNTAAAERHVTWNPDNRSIAYTSERDGHWNIYMAKISRKDDLNFPNATLVEETPLFPADDLTERTYPSFSPDGKELAFIQDRNKLMVMNLETKAIRQITDGKTHARRNGGFDYSWSPDSKWFVLTVVDNKHDPYSDIAIVSAQGGEITNITRSGYFDECPRWTPDGNAITFLSERYGMRNHASWGSEADVMMVFLNQDAYDKYRLSEEDYALLKEVEKEQKKAKEKESSDKKDKKGNKGKKKDNAETGNDNGKATDIVVETDGISDRIVRVTPYSSDISNAIVTNDNETMYYLSSAGKGYDLWKIELRKRGAKSVSKLDAGYMNMELDKEGKNLFLLGGKSMKKMDIKSEKLTPITYSVSMKLDAAAEREYMFDYVYRQEREMFYTTGMHGVDWERMSADYRRFLPHINNNHDFAELLSEWLGELNVSHTGGRYYPKATGEPTAELGLLLDWDYSGEGLKVTEVIENGPFDRASSAVKPGCIIEKLNGTEITSTTDYTPLLNGLAKKKTLVSIYDPETGKRHDEVILPITGGQMNELLYTRWTKQRADDVERWSNGRLGYVHIRSMNDDSFRKVYSDVLGKFNHCEGIVIDTRWNGGGRLHEDVEILFSGQKYFTQVIRGTETCDMPSRRWNKPSIMIQCEANYSNAHGTPWVYKNRGIGKLVGMPVPGTMTSVNWVTLQDPTLVFGIPVVGYRLPDGSYLENQQLNPDILVSNDPATAVNGEDTQLRVAVETLLRDLDK